MILLHEDGKRVYCIGNPAISGLVRCTYELSDGSIWCVVETDEGNQFFNQQEKLRTHKILPPLVRSSS